jgi:PAS domain S-box-containing protein
MTGKIAAPEYWRVRILDLGSGTLAALAALTLLLIWREPVISNSQAFEGWAVATVSVLGVCALWRRGPYRLRAMIVVAVSVLTSSVFLIRVGFTAAPALAGLSAVVIAGLLLGVRSAVLTWAATTAFLATTALLISRGDLPSNFDPELVDPGNYSFGLRYALTYATFAAIIAVGVAVVVARLSSSLADLRVALDEKRVSQEQWESLVDCAPDQILILDREHRIEFRNRGLLGYAEDEVVGVLLEDLMPADDKSSIFEAIEAVFETAQNGHYELALEHKSGAPLWLSSRVSPVWRDGRVHRVTVISTDITDRHHLEGQLRQAQKMDAVGQLAGGVAHDFNNLLTVILGYGEEALEKTKHDTALQQHLTAILEASERGAALTRQLLSFSQQQTSRAELLSPGEVVHQLAPMLRRLLEDEIELDLELSPGVGAVRVDRGQLEQVLTNLVVNARDAMPAGGPIRVSTADVHLDAAEAGSLGVEAGDYVALSVVDSGVGMTPEEIAMIFDPFYTTKETGKGTGLGLSTAYGIVQAVGGAIRADSRPDEGSRFEVLLPRSTSESPAQHPVERPQERVAAAVASRGVLVVEDEDRVRTLLCATLDRAGYRVLEAADGAEALSTYHAHRESIDAVLTDVRMPAMSGPELAETLEKQDPDLTVVFMTGYPAEVAISHRNVEVIPKPFSPQQLLRRLDTILERPPAT